MIERSHIGGTCVNEGCTPTKTMISSGRVAYLTKRGPQDYGVHYPSGGASGVWVDMTKVRQRKRDIVASFSGGSENRLVKAGVDILKGEARFVDGKTLAVKMNDGGEEKTVSADLIFISVGESPTRPDIPGLDSLDQAVVLNSTSIMELAEVPKHLIVLGGGYIGLEFGQLFRRLGAEVTVVQRATQLVPREDVDVAKCMLNIMQEDGITVHLSATAKAFSTTQNNADLPITLEIGKDGQSLTISGSHVLLATGRKPNTAGLGLDTAGVKTTARGHVVVDDKLATNVPGIYALGDVHGGPAFTHISYDDFRIIRNNLLPDRLPATTPAMATTAASSSRNFVPYVMYTDPQLGHVGLHERDVEVLRREKGRKIKTAIMPMSYVARALETDETRGMMKAHVDADTGDILGFTCLGVDGGEVMAVMQTAMMGGLKWWDLEAAVWAHPSLAESLNNLWGFLE
jgi:pyruvate/2-oxoglutarate dehydrogenase complex dihydrolipoamide dehydrogenase (E3) component